MRTFSFVCVFLFLFGCSDTISKEGLHALNGYWEIDKVVFPDGGSKEYKANTTLDYFEIDMDNLKGFRKKVNPKLDGTYDTSDDAEFFMISIDPKAVWLNYKNDLSSWKEQLVSVGSNSFTVCNEEGITYQYKRFQPINLSE